MLLHAMRTGLCVASSQRYGMAPVRCNMVAALAVMLEVRKESHVCQPHPNTTQSLGRVPPSCPR
eukprot:364915-Chlamydomonas_euryale.AAC.23